MPIQDVLAIILSLLASGGWLIQKLDGFQWLRNINDEKGVVIPSLLFLASPFLAIWSMSALMDGSIDEMIKPVLPLATFILGQTIANRAKQEENKAQKIALSTMLIFKLEQNIIQAIATIEGRLMSIPQDEEEKALFEIKALCEKYKLEIENLYENLSSQLEIIKANRGIDILLYMDKIKKYIERLASISLTPENRLYSLADIRLYIVEGYSNIIALIEESISDDKAVHDQFFSRCIFKLNWERKRLLQFKQTRESTIRNWENRPRSERPLGSDVDLYFRFDIDPEGQAIQEIESLLQRLRIPIQSIDFDSRI